MMRRKTKALSFIFSLLGATSCHLVLGIEEAEPIPGGSTPSCTVDADCNDDNVCTTDRCSTGQCLNKKETGTAPSSMQTAEDCREFVCDAGVLVEQIDPFDAPSDGKDCTLDQCDENGMPSYAPLASKTPCSQDSGTVCNGSGQCVQCVDDEQCTAPATCGGGATPNSCGCTPLTCQSGNLSCGELVDDGCGNPLNCDNQMLDGSETDIDCGGDSNACSRRCQDGYSCSQASDCANNICDNTICDSGSWSKGFGDNAFDEVSALATDPQGAVIATGNFGGGINLGGTTLQSKGGQDIFLAKLDTYGRHQWSVSFGDSGSQNATSVAVDSVGNIYLAGYYTGSIDLGGGFLTSTQSANWFLAKFDKDGTFLWNQTAGTSNVVQRVQGVAVDSQGNAIIVGYFAGSFGLTNSSITLTSQGGSDVFVAKFDPNGLPLWGARFGDSEEQRGRAVAVDSSDNVILAGQFRGNLQVGNTPLQSSGDIDLWVAKLNKDGVAQWALAAGDTSAQCNGDCNIALAAMSNEDIVIATDFRGTINLGGGGLVSAGGTDIALARLTAQGQHVFSLPLGNNEEQHVGAVQVDSSDNILACATIEGPLTVGTMGGSTGNSDILIAKLDAAATMVSGSFFGDGANQSCSALALDGQGRLRLGGITRGSLDMKTASPPYIAAGSGDAWLAKLVP